MGILFVLSIRRILSEKNQKMLHLLTLVSIPVCLTSLQAISHILVHTWMDFVRNCVVDTCDNACGYMLSESLGQGWILIRYCAH